VRRTIDAHALAGHRTVPPEEYTVIVSCLLSLFLNSIVMETVIAWTRDQ